VRVEPELVDGVVAGEPVPQELGDRTDLLGQLIAGLLGVGSGARVPAVLIYFAYDGGDLVRRCPGFGFGEQ